MTTVLVYQLSAIWSSSWVVVTSAEMIRFDFFSSITVKRRLSSGWETASAPSASDSRIMGSGRFAGCSSFIVLELGCARMRCQLQVLRGKAKEGGRRHETCLLWSGCDVGQLPGVLSVQFSAHGLPVCISSFEYIARSRPWVKISHYSSRQKSFHQIGLIHPSKISSYFGEAIVLTDLVLQRLTAALLGGRFAALG